MSEPIAEEIAAEEAAYADFKVNAWKKASPERAGHLSGWNACAEYWRAKFLAAAPSRDRTDPLPQSSEKAARQDDPFVWLIDEISREFYSPKVLEGVRELYRDWRFQCEEVAAQKALRHVPPVGPQGHPEPVAWRWFSYGEWHLQHAPPGVEPPPAEWNPEPLYLAASLVVGLPE